MNSIVNRSQCETSRSKSATEYKSLMLYKQPHLSFFLFIFYINIVLLKLQGGFSTICDRAH